LDSSHEVHTNDQTVKAAEGKGKAAHTTQEDTDDKQTQNTASDDKKRGCCSHLRLRTMLLCGLVLPVLVFVAVVLGISAVLTVGVLQQWLDPVEDSLVVQQRISLPITANIQHDFTASVFKRGANSLIAVADYTEAVWNAQHSLSVSANASDGYNIELLANYPVYYSPSSVSTAVSTLPPGGIQPNPRFPTLRSFDSCMHTSAFYQNGDSGYNSSQNNFSNPSQRADWNVSLATQRNLSHFDNIARAVYFANDDILNVYFATEAHEAVRLYPYRNLSSFLTFSYTCVVDNMTRIGFTPVCRSWYVKLTNV